MNKGDALACVLFVLAMCYGWYVFTTYVIAAGELSLLF